MSSHMDEQQPVAWMDDFGNAFPLAANKGAGSWRDSDKRNWKPLYALPVADNAIKNHKPVAKITGSGVLVNDEGERIVLELAGGDGEVPLYALPVADKDAERLLGLCKWCAGRLTDAGDDEGSAKVMESLAAMAKGE